ncbi:hypothetical protein FISHEDRAFT_42547, partial [Fistulina hepatica ATCC 64428]
LWYRDPVECIRELIGNPVFRDAMAYAPETLYEGADGKTRIVNEMHTAEWWMDIQHRLGQKGATIAPVILSSDKTQLTQFRGDVSAWPVYLSIGNISKEVRRQGSSHATVLIGYLPVAKLTCLTKSKQQFERYRLFHYCMSLLTKTLATAGRTGVFMGCADGMERWIWPILAAYVADFPEQCLISCSMESRCPICTVPSDQRGTNAPYDWRDMREHLYLLAQSSANHYANQDCKDRAESLGIRPIFPPFWAHLLHCDAFRIYTPDLLHQLHKGVFKDHLVKWCTKILGPEELDACFMSLPSYKGLRHFSNGISGVSQWTSAEHKAMEKVFVPLICGSVNNRVIQAARGGNLNIVS